MWWLGEYCEPCYHKLLNEEYNKLTELEKDEIFSYYGSWDNLTVFEKGDALIGEIKDVPYDELLDWAGEQEQEACEYAYELKCEREFDEYWSQR